MGNPPRYVPPGSLVEVTTRTIQGRFLLRPSRDLNDIAVGIIARAAKRYAVEVVDFKILGNHAHALLVPRDAEQLALFMDYLNGNLAKEAGRLHSWHDRFWSRRYRAIIVSDEPEAQEGRLRYLLAQGCKEGLVRSPLEWPGASSTAALLSGERLSGWWFDRTAEFNARRRGESFGKYTHAQREELSLAPLPCWRALSAEDRRRRAAAMVREIEHETRQRLCRLGRSPLGVKRILAQHPHDAPTHPSRSPAPRFHAATGLMRKALEIAFRRFCDRYRDAADAVRSGQANVPFPTGSFPPRLPFARGRPGASTAPI